MDPGMVRLPSFTLHHPTATTAPPTIELLQNHAREAGAAARGADHAVADPHESGERSVRLLQRRPELHPNLPLTLHADPNYWVVQQLQAAK